MIKEIKMKNKIKLPVLIFIISLYCLSCIRMDSKDKKIIQQPNLFNYNTININKKKLNFSPAYNNSGNYYKKEYEKLDDVHAKKYRTIFERVRNVADESSNRIPRLILLKENVSPYVFSLSDGSIIICKKVIDLCYFQVDESLGDARMAFIIGHELAHLARDDFWLLDKRNFADSNIIDNNKIQKNQEIRADAYGFIYASIAGFPVNKMVENKKIDFFYEFSDYISERNKTNSMQTFASHPEPQYRGEALYQRILKVKENVEIYKSAIRLFQLGKYDLALDFFRYFCELYPSREVFNNMGLVHYEKAINMLAICDDDLAYRFYLINILDQRTRAEMFLKQRSNEKCLQNESFKNEIEEAIRMFKRACKKDKNYLPSKINLSSALIATGYKPYYISAESILTEAQQKNNDKKILNNLSLVRYLINPDYYYETAIKDLRNILAQYPDFYPAQYNLARMLSEKNGYDDLQSIQEWNTFLNMGSGGQYDYIAHRLLNNEQINIKKYDQNFSDFNVYTLIMPEFVTDDIDNRIINNEINKKPLSFGDTWDFFYINKEITALVFDRSVIYVEYLYNQQQNIQTIKDNFGPPKKIHFNIENTQTLVYDKFALDLNGDNIIKFIRYQK